MIAIAMECLRDGATDLEMRELILMFLVNMSRDEKGAASLMQEGEEVEGLHVRRLLHWFCQSAPAAAPGYAAPGSNRGPVAPAPVMDPNAYIAHILTNISQTVAGRKLLLNEERGVIPLLKPQLTSPQPIRQLGTFQLMKNLFMEQSKLEYLLSPPLALLPSLLRPIIGPEPFLHGESEYKGIDPAVRALMTPDKRRDSDPQIRLLVYEILLLCARYKPSRALLRSRAIYPILRHAHDADKADSDPDCRDLDDLLEGLIPYFILDEDDQAHPEQMEAEKRRARVEQVKALNEDADANETKEQRRERLAKEAADADKPVHYLGDELGGEVRKREAAAAAASSGSSVEKKPATAGPSASVDLDEAFPDMEPLGAAETLQLGDVQHNVQSLEAARDADKKAAAPAPAAPDYAQSAAEEDVGIEDEREDEEEDDEDDAPPPLADEDEEEDEQREGQYLNGLD